MPYLSIGAVTYLGYIIPLSSVAAKLIVVAIIWIFAATNIVGVRLGAVVMRWLAVLKIGLLAAIMLWAVLLQRGDWSNFLPLVAQRPGSDPLIGALAGSLVAAFFSFGGWWDVSKLGGEVQNPSRTLPRALAYGVITVTVVYMLTSAVFLYLVPAERVTSADAFASQAGEVLFGRTGGVIFSVIVIISVLGSLEAVVMSAPRVYFAMARDQLFLPAAAALHPRFKTPTRAIMLQAGLATLLALSGSFNQIIAYFIFITVVFIALTVAAVFVLRKKYPDAPAFRVPGYPFTPLLFLIFVTALLSLLAMQNPLQAFFGVAVVGLGALVYRYIFNKRDVFKP